MASVGFTLGPRDKVVARAPTKMERRYCDSVRVCEHTGWEMKCGAPLRWNGGPALSRDSWTCTVCGLVTWRNPGAWRRFDEREKAGEEWGVKQKEANAYVDERRGYPMTHHDGATCSDRYMASIERQMRPRAAVEDIEPYWQCSNREVLDELGITAEVMSMADAIAVRGYDQLPAEMQAFLDDPGETHEHPLPLESNSGIGHTSSEWRDAIAKLHRNDATWMSPINAVMALRTKETYGIGPLRPDARGDNAWGCVPYSQLRSAATIAYVMLTSTSHWYAATPSLVGAGNSVTGEPLVVSATQSTALDEDDDG